DNGCRLCPKVFCCTDCRDVHENTKHPKPQCSLCIKQDLPYKPNHEETPEESRLLCHVALNHLPIRCKLCGEIYQTSRDFALAKDCSWWSRQKEQPPPQIKIIADQLPATPTLQSSTYHQEPTTSSASINPLKRHYQHQQQYQESGNFDSPPAVGSNELVRHTSTPVQSSASSTLAIKRQNSAPSCLNSTPSPQLASGCSTGASLKRSAAALIHHQLQPRLSLSPASALDSCYVDRTNDSEQSSWPHSILKGGSVMRSSSTNNDSASKRVRFSEDHNPNFNLINPERASSIEPTEIQSNQNDNSLNEVYYEARTSIDEPDCVNSTVDASSPDSLTNTENDEKLQNINNEKKEVKEGEDGIQQVDEEEIKNCTQDTKLNEERSGDSGFGNCGRSSSRLVMMLVVEKTDSDQSLGSLDLEPLINSGLKKLEEDLATTSAIASNHDRGKEVASNKHNQDTGNNEDERRCCIVRPSSSSSCSSSSSLTTSVTRSDYEVRCIRKGRATTGIADAIGAEVVVKADGLLSMVARVFRCALNKLQPAMVASAMASAAAASSTSSCTLGGVGSSRSIEPKNMRSHIKSSASSSSSSISIATASTIVLQQQQKRSNSFKRPRADSTDERTSSPSKRSSP
ncbi:hypothetical protein QAD02_011898, partial [Eretmocerus hayati]